MVKSADEGSVQVQVILVGWYVVLWRFVMLAGGTGTR